MASVPPSFVPVQDPAALAPLVPPNNYRLQGNGITVTYQPAGAGGISHLTYQDSEHPRTFSGDQIKTVDVPNLGTIATVSLSFMPGAPLKFFSLLLPVMLLPNHAGASVTIDSEGITSTHRFPSGIPTILPMIRAGQQQTYLVTPLTGSASIITIPLEAGSH